MLLLTASVFQLLALLSGIALLAAPFGEPAASGFIHWIAFPVGALLGPTLFIMVRDRCCADRACNISGGVLLMLGFSGLLLGFLTGNDVLTIFPGDSLPFWFVAGVGLAFGSGALALRALFGCRKA